MSVSPKNASWASCYNLPYTVLKASPGTANLDGMLFDIPYIVDWNLRETKATLNYHYYENVKNQKNQF